MNNERRKAIVAAIEELQKALEAIRDVPDEIETIAGEERGALESLPESIQQGEQGEKMNNVVDFRAGKRHPVSRGGERLMPPILHTSQLDAVKVMQRSEAEHEFVRMQIERGVGERDIITVDLTPKEACQLAEGLQLIAALQLAR
jgi:hypothetical protein